MVPESPFALWSFRVILEGRKGDVEACLAHGRVLSLESLLAHVYETDRGTDSSKC